MDQGGVAYGDGHRRNVWPEVRALLRDAELSAWIDAQRAENPDLIRRM